MSTYTPDLGEMPEGWIPLDAVAVVKCLDDEGREALLLRSTGNLSTWEELGMIMAGEVVRKGELADSFEPDESE